MNRRPWTGKAQRLILGVVITCLLSTVYCLPAHSASYEPYKAAVLRGVDKITGHVEMFDAAVDEAVRFGTLYVTVRSCQKTPPEETPEAAAFLEIDEVKADAATQRWYSGWMFASSPALSPLEHPVYDVWVVDCKNKIETVGEPNDKQ